MNTLKLVVLFSLVVVTYGQKPGLCIIRNLLSCATYLGSDIFHKLVKNASITNEFDFPGGKTLLLPSEAALEGIPASVMTNLQNNHTYLKDVLRYHLITESVKCMKLDDNTKETTKQGTQIRFNTYNSPKGDSMVIAEGAKFLDISETTTLTGKICVIDRMLYDIPRQNIYSYLSQDRNLTTFLLLASKSGSLDIFKGEDMTLLVPDNRAFSKLAPGILQKLTENSSLMKDVISYHMANSVQFFQGLLFSKSFKSTSGNDFPVKISGKDDMVGPAKFLKPDILAANGVVHVIDTVLLNPNSTIADEWNDTTF